MVNFPNNPNVNDSFSYGDKKWVWTGSLWKSGLSIGTQGSTGAQGIQGIQGTQGNAGLAFTIAKTYASVAALTADTAPTNIVSGQFALINTSDVENSENSRLYIWNGSSYIFVDDLSGAAGIQGITGSQGTQGTQGTQGAQGSAKAYIRLYIYA